MQVYNIHKGYTWKLFLAIPFAFLVQFSLASLSCSSDKLLLLGDAQPKYAEKGVGWGRIRMHRALKDAMQCNCIAFHYAMTSPCTKQVKDVAGSQQGLYATIASLPHRIVLVYDPKKIIYLAMLHPSGFFAEPKCFGM